jgi:glycosidase
MKLLVILSIKEHSDIVRKILVRQNIPVYSETDIRGFRMDNVKETDPSNWFVSRGETIYSNLFFVFENDESSKRVLEELKKYNKEHESSEYSYNPLHAYRLNVEDSV